jgi:hypothetical protein
VIEERVDISPKKGKGVKRTSLGNAKAECEEMQNDASNIKPTLKRARKQMQEPSAPSIISLSVQRHPTIDLTTSPAAANKAPDVHSPTPPRNKKPRIAKTAAEAKKSMQCGSHLALTVVECPHNKYMNQSFVFSIPIRNKPEKANKKGIRPAKNSSITGDIIEIGRGAPDGEVKLEDDNFLSEKYFNDI